MPRCATEPKQQPSVANVKAKTTLEKVADFYSEIAKRSGVMSDAAKIELDLSEELAIRTTNLATAASLSGHKYNKLQSAMASLLGIKSMLWDSATLGKTKAGAVRQLFQQRLVESRNLMTWASLNKALPDIKRLYDTLKSNPSVNVTELDSTLHDIVVAGHYRKLVNTVNSPIVEMQLTQRFNKLNADIAQKGFSVAQTNEMFKLAEKIVGTYDELRLIANRNGLSLETLQNGGYFPIQMQREMSNYINKLNESITVGNGLTKIDINNIIGKKRNWRVPLLVDPEQAAKVFDMPLLDFYATFLEPGGFKSLVNKLSDEQVNKLIDIGILSSAPAMTDELLGFIKNVDTGIDDINDALILNPVEALRQYTSRLEAEMTQNNLVKTLLDEGRELGWLYTKETIPNARDFIRLGNAKTLSEVFESQKLAEEVADLYVHRTVADQFKALVRLNTSPSELGALGSAWNGFTKVFSRTLLLSGNLAYLQRVFFSNSISQLAATGSLDTLGVAMIDQIRVLKNGVNSLPTKTVYTVGGKKYNLRQLYKELLLKRDTSLASAVSVSVDQLADPFNQLSRKSLQRMAKFNELYYKKFGSPLASKLSFAGELADKTFNTIMSPLLFGNQFLDFTSRWATVRNLAATRKWENIDELLAYTDEYFNIQSDVGSLGKVAGQIAPFVGFALSSPGSAVRHFMRHPWQSANILSLYNQFNSQTELSQAEIPDWMSNDYFIIAHKDQDTGKYYAINTSGIDFYLDTATNIKDLAIGVSRALGQRAGTVKGQLQSEIDPHKWIADTTLALLDKVYLGDTAKALLNIDQPAEQLQDALLGVPISSRVKSILVSSAPILSAIDRALPDSIAGRSAKKDILGNITEQGQPSWFGVTPTNRKTKTKTDSAIQRFTSLVGINLSEIDPNNTLLRNYKDFGSMLGDIRKSKALIQQRLIKETLTESERANLELARQKLVDIETIIVYNRLRMNSMSSRYPDRIKISPLTVESYKSKESRAIGKLTENEAELKLLDRYLKDNE